MKNQIYTFFVSLLLFSNIASASDIVDSKKTCKDIPSFREKLEELESKSRKLKILLEMSGFSSKEAIILSAEVDSELAGLKKNLKTLEKACESVDALNSCYLGRLKGFETIKTFDRLNRLLEQMKDLDERALRVDEDSLQELKEAAVFMAKVAMDTLESVREKNELKMAMARMDLERSTYDMVLVLIKVLAIDVSDIDHIETLFERIELRIQELLSMRETG